jgi:hypothetical protein
MDPSIDVRNGVAPVRAVRIDRLVGPLFWVKWANTALLTLALYIPIVIVSSALRNQLDPSIFGWALVLIFPICIALKNVNIINSLNQRLTILSLLMAGVPAVGLGLLSLPLLLGWWSAKIGQGRYMFCAIIGGVFALLAACAVWRLRHRRIDPLGVNLVDLLSTLSEQGAPGRLSNIGPRRPLLGSALIVAAVIVVLGKDFIPSTWTWTQAESFGELTFGLLIVMAQSAFQPNANRVLKADSRKPALLLRSFIDDEWVNWQISEITLFDVSLESRLVSHFARYGPFVAVGAPSERMPIIGAARVKLTDAQWQDQVVHWIDISGVILMMAGITDWVEWEMKQVIAHNAVGRLIICFPPIRTRKWKERSLRNFSTNMNARLDRLRRAFAETRWHAALLQLDDAKSLRSLVFEGDGCLTVVRARSRNRNAYQLAVLIAHWVRRAGLPDGKVGTHKAMLASKGPQCWVNLGIAAALLAYGCGVPILYTTAMYELGQYYANGWGVAQDYGKARGLIQKAAKAGNPDAMYDLGVLYANGWGIAQDCTSPEKTDTQFSVFLYCVIGGIG